MYHIAIFYSLNFHLFHKFKNSICIQINPMMSRNSPLDLMKNSVCHPHILVRSDLTLFGIFDLGHVNMLVQVYLCINFEKMGLLSKWKI